VDASPHALHAVSGDEEEVETSINEDEEPEVDDDGDDSEAEFNAVEAETVFEI
jgi:hypothetical protein